MASYGSTCDGLGRTPEPRRHETWYGAPSSRREPRVSSPVSRILSWVAIYLGRPLPDGSCGQPGGFRRATLERLPIRPCTGWGLPGRRVTTTPVRSYRTFSPLQPDKPACCVFSVALSLGFPPLDVIQHPALWCPDFPRSCARRGPATTRAATPSIALLGRVAVDQLSGQRAVLGDGK